MIRIPFVSGKAKITSKYGERTLNGVKDFHKGLDIVGISDTTVVSITSGTVIQSQIIKDKTNRTWQWGNYVCVRTDDNKLIYYCHLKSRAVNVGDKVCAGDTIGVMGNTGYSFGAHLHLEVREASKSINTAMYLGIPNSVGVIKNTAYSRALWRLTIMKIIASPEYWEVFEKETRVRDIMIRLEAAFPKTVRLSESDYKTSDAMKIDSAIDILYDAGVIMDKAFWKTNHVKYKYIDVLLKRVAYALEYIV